MYLKHELFIGNLGEFKQTLRAHIYPTSTVNVLSEKDYENLDPKPELKNQETEILIFGFPTLIVGQFVARLENEDKSTIADFFILPDTKNSIITLDVAKKLSLLETRAEFPRKERENDDTQSNAKKTTKNKNDIKNTKETTENKRKQPTEQNNKNEQKKNNEWTEKTN